MILNGDKTTINGDQRKKHKVSTIVPNQIRKPMIMLVENVEKSDIIKRIIVFKNKQKNLKGMGHASSSKDQNTKGKVAKLDEKSLLNFSYTDSNMNISHDDIS